MLSQEISYLLIVFPSTFQMMKQSTSLKNLLLLVGLSCLLVSVWSAGVCNRCMENNIACVNRTHFKYCLNSEPISDATLYCGDGKICTDLDMFCFNDNLGVPPVCEDKDVNCRSCQGGTMFVCTSRTTFRQCNGEAFSSETMTCPENTVCSINSGEFCVKDCNLPDGKYECNRDAPLA